MTDMTEMMGAMARATRGRDDTEIIGRISQFLVDLGDPGPDILVPPGASLDDVTVLLPTDNAFRQFVRDTALGAEVRGMSKREIGDYLLETLSTEELYDILLYLIAFDGQTLAELQDAGPRQTALGPTWEVVGTTIADQDPDAADARFISTDRPFDGSDGTISHIVNAVPRPFDFEALPAPAGPTLYDKLTRKPPSFDHNGSDHDILSALVRIGGKDLLDDPTTDLVFVAPNDRAMAHFARELGFGGWSDERALVDYFKAALPLGLDLSRGEAIETFLTAQIAPGVSGPVPLSHGRSTEASNGVLVKGGSVAFEFTGLPSDGSDDVDLFIGTNRRDYAITRDDADVIYGRGGGDYVISGTGDDMVMGGNGGDWIVAGDGNDTVIGGRGRDQIWASAGDDVVTGGRGNDRISLGHGEDVFIYRPNDGFDRLFDFSAEDDVIDLTAFREADGTEAAVTISSGHGTALVFVNGRAALQLEQFSDTTLTEDNFIL